MSEHKYKLTYELTKHPEGILKKDMKQGPGGGACDAVLFCSLIYPEDGSFSVYFIGVDGRKKKNNDPLEDREWFKVWTLLGKRLAASTTLDKEKKDMCLRASESVMFKVLGYSLN